MAGVIPDDEPLPIYLTRRERELVQRSASIRGQLVPVERELAEVRKAMDALGLSHGSDLTDLMATAAAQQPAPQSALQALQQTNSNASVGQSALETVTAATAKAITEAASLLTIKQMILAALQDHFHDGASPTELSEYMQNAYAREVDRNSISPQLARLREEGMLNLHEGGKWKLSQQGLSILTYGTHKMGIGGNAAWWASRKPRSKFQDLKLIWATARAARRGP
jgi:hypothetical protein